MKSILIVDDEERIRRVYGEVFRKEGYEVLTAASAVEARRILLDRPVDLLLLDINMDEVRGDELHEVVACFHGTTKVIVSSVYPVDEQRALIPEAADYFDKSEGIHALVRKVRGILPVGARGSVAAGGIDRGGEPEGR